MRVLSSLLFAFLLVSGSHPSPARAAEAPAQRALLELFPEFRSKLADKNIYGLEQSTYAKAVWKFRLLVGSPQDSDGVLAPSEEALLADVRNVRIMGSKLLADFKNEGLHRQLVSSGLLDAELGHVSLNDFREAVMALRTASGTENFGGLNDTEKSELARVADEVEKFAGFKDVLGGDQFFGGNLRLPAALVSQTPDSGSSGSQWRTYTSSADKSIRVHSFVQGTSANTPLSLAGMLLPDEPDGDEVWRRMFFSEITSEDFVIESATRNKSGTTFLNNAAGWGRGNRVLGMKFTADWNPLPDAARAAPKLPDPDPEARAALNEEQLLSRNWERLTKVLWNLMLSDYKRLNGWTLAQTGKDCVNKRETFGQWIAVVYATNRKEHEKYQSRDAAAANKAAAGELFKSDPDTALHIGCTRVWVPDNYKLEFDLRGLVGKGDPGSASNLRYAHYDVTASPIRHGYQVREDHDLDFVDPVKNSWTKAMLFVHGYNNSFADGVLRAAQMAAASEFKGRVYLFSWPARDSQWAYLPSIDIAEQAEIDLQYFLKLIMSRTKSLELDIVAHSMGSQILLRALGNRSAVFDRRQGEERTDRVRLRNLIFAAPDVADVVFQRKIPDIAKFARTVTVFASACDGAIAFSKLLRGNSPRAGGLDSSRRPIELPEEAGRVDVVDVTYASGGRYCSGNLRRFIGANHSAFAFEPEILEQIKGILSTDRVIKSPPGRIADENATYEFAECQYPSSRPDNKRAFWVMKQKGESADACPVVEAASRAE